MKLSLALVLFLCGCMSPVPSTKFSGSIGGQPFEFEGHKQTTAKGLELSLVTGTNNFKLRIDELSSQNDPQVIDKSFSGQALVTKTFFDGVNDFASKLIEGAAKGAVKGVKP